VLNQIHELDPGLVTVCETLPNAEVLHVFGDADIATAPDLVEAIAAIDSPLPLIVDLRECAFIDTSGIQVLVNASKRLGRSRFKVVVAAGSQIERIFGIIRLRDIVPITNGIE
jgi:anti-anti-sigma factor